MKRLLIEWLVYLTDVPNAPLPGEATENFLAEMWMNEGFRSYLHARERALEKYLSRGLGAGGVDEHKPVKTANYLLGFGQLQELSNLMRTAKNAYEAKHKRIADQKKAVINTPQ